jgi:hypothetical protein
MSALIACISCKTVGFVRREFVLQGTTSYTNHYCGHCLHRWTSPRAADATAAANSEPADNKPTRTKL